MKEEVIVRVDEKYRVALGRRLRDVAKISKGERLVAIPFHGGVVLQVTKGLRFVGSLRGFAFEESKHEGAKYVSKMMKNASS